MLILALLLACVDKDGGTDPTGDGGTADGGLTDGGIADGGTSADGGGTETDGGTADGGTADAGTTDGGTADGGTADGGTADGGTTWVDPDGPVLATFTGYEPYEQDQWTRQASGGGATRVISLYEPHPEDGDPVRVTVDLVGPTHLFLLSYEDVAWEIEETTPGTVQSIVWGCGDGTTLSAPAGIETFTYDSYALCSKVEWLEFSMREVEHEASIRGLPPVASTHTVYRADTVELAAGGVWSEDASFGDCSSTADDVAFGPPDTSWVASRCPQLDEDTAACLTYHGYEVVLMGVDTGAECWLRDAPIYAGSTEAYRSAEWSGTRLYLVWDQYLLTEISLVDDAWQRALVYGLGVARDGDRLLLRRGPSADGWYDGGAEMVGFDSFYQARCEDPDLSPVPDVSASGSVLFEVDDDLAYVRSASSDLDLVDLATGTSLGSLYLQGADSRLYGLSVVDDDRLAAIIDGGETLTIYQRDSGLLLASHPLDDFHQGLACAALDGR